jgi:hypothetical protein
MAAEPKQDSKTGTKSRRPNAVERRFFEAVENPKPAPAHLKEMVRLYGSGTTAKTSGSVKRDGSAK